MFGVPIIFSHFSFLALHSPLCQDLSVHTGIKTMYREEKKSPICLWLLRVAHCILAFSTLCLFSKLQALRSLDGTVESLPAPLHSPSRGLQPPLILWKNSAFSSVALLRLLAQAAALSPASLPTPTLRCLGALYPSQPYSLPLIHFPLQADFPACSRLIDSAWILRSLLRLLSFS